MTSRKPPSKFKLSTIKQFDARRGYKRCTVPGVVATIVGERTNPHADFWWDPEGKLVVRFRCSDEVIHLVATKVTGRKFKESDFDEFFDFVSDTLYEWVIEGIDDLPSSIYATSD